MAGSSTIPCYLSSFFINTLDYLLVCYTHTLIMGLDTGLYKTISLEPATSLSFTFIFFYIIQII